MIDPATFNLLRQFRAGVYQRFDKRAEALFELLDAVTVAGLVPSLAYLSLPPVHRRRWGSLYDALGGHPRASTARSTRSMARYGCARGPACTPRRTIIHPAKGSYRTKAVVRGTLVLVE